MTTIDEAFRDYNVDGNPTSGVFAPVKSGIRNALKDAANLTTGNLALARLSLLFSAANNHWDGAQHFKAGPWADVTHEDYGAIAGGGAGDAATNVAAFNAALSSGAAVVFVPAGDYYLNATITIPAGVTLLGCGPISSILHATGDISPCLIYSDGQYGKLVGFNISGGGVGSSNPTVTIDTGAVNFFLRDLIVGGGHLGLNLLAPDITVEDCNCAYSYGVAAVRVAAGMWMRRVKVDQNWPTTAPTAISGWTALTHYNADDVVTLTNYTVQCTQSGTTGSSEPAPQDYFVDINDGSAKWRLVSANTYSGILFDAANPGELQADHMDFTGCFTYGIKVDIASGGLANLRLSDSVMGQNYGGNVFVSNGSEIDITACELGGATATGSAAVTLDTGADGDVTITGGSLSGNGYAVYVAGGTGVTVQGARIRGGTIAGIHLHASQQGLVVQGCIFKNGGVAVRIESGCDYYNIRGNLLNGGSISDAASGAHSTVDGNN